MTDKKAKDHLRKMLDSFTVGSVLHLLGDIFHEETEEARRAGDDLGYRQCRRVSDTLFVVGLGIDAALPR